MRAHWDFDDRKTAERGGCFLCAYTSAIELLEFAYPIYARRYNLAGIHRVSYPKQLVL